MFSRLTILLFVFFAVAGLLRVTAPQTRVTDAESAQGPFENPSGRGENGVQRAPERSILEVREHRSAAGRRLQTGLTDLRADSQP
jgi:hypothetical protein